MFSGMSFWGERIIFRPGRASKTSSKAMGDFESDLQVSGKVVRFFGAEHLSGGLSAGEERSFSADHQYPRFGDVPKVIESLFAGVLDLQDQGVAVGRAEQQPSQASDEDAEPTGAGERVILGSQDGEGENEFGV